MGSRSSTCWSRSCVTACAPRIQRSSQSTIAIAPAMARSDDERAEPGAGWSSSLKQQQPRAAAAYKKSAQRQIEGSRAGAGAPGARGYPRGAWREVNIRGIYITPKLEIRYFLKFCSCASTTTTNTGVWCGPSWVRFFPGGLFLFLPSPLNETALLCSRRVDSCPSCFA